MMMNRAAANAQIVETVVQIPNLSTVKTSLANMAAGQMRTKRIVKKIPPP